MSVSSAGRAAAFAAALLVSACASDGGKLATDPERPWTVDPRNITSADDLIERADAARAAGEHFAAANFYQRANFLRRMEKRQDDEPLMGLGRSMMAIGGYAEAAEAFRAVVKMKGRYHDARIGLGFALLALGQPLVAKEHFAVAMQVQPTSQTYNGMGVAHDMVKDHESAQQFYRAGLEIAPEDRHLRNNLGLSLALGGNFSAALPLLAEQAQGPDVSPREKMNLALAESLSGNARGVGNAAAFDFDYYAGRARTERVQNLSALRATWIEDGVVRGLQDQTQTAQSSKLADPADAPAPTEPVVIQAAAAPDESPAAASHAPEHGAPPDTPEHGAPPGPPAAPPPLNASGHAVMAPPVLLPNGIPDMAPPPALDTAFPPEPVLPPSTAPRKIAPPAAVAVHPPVTAAPPAAIAAEAPVTAAPHTAANINPPVAHTLPQTLDPMPAPEHGATAHAGANNSPVMAPYSQVPSGVSRGVALDAPSQVLAPYGQAPPSMNVVPLTPAPPAVLSPYQAPAAVAPHPRQAAAPNGQRGFQVQMGSFRDRTRAGRRWAQLRRAAPKLFSGMVPVVEEARVGPARNRFYRLRTSPFNNRAKAQSFCGRLTARAIPCIVVTAR